MPDTTTIELKDIRKTYTMGEARIYALRGINLTIKQGEMVAVMGASGSGKSTFLNIVGCLDKPTKGTYYLDGENVSELDKDQLATIRNKRLGFVFQGFNLLGRATVEANVELPMIYAGVEKKEMAVRAKDALQWVGLSKYLHHYPNQMSGGQQQRVAIARALVNNPSLILADEPTGALDSRTSIEIVAVIQRLNQEKGITVVMVTHEKDIAQYCKRLVTIKDGHVIEDTPVLNQRNADEDLAALPVEAEAGL
ncbi:Macrolide export ATP-binding/permease protein MacB [Pelotomaculum schinkii]|uniref:Macrolide export ATP-binding/permease protein MacB n=1 Tax=Pelotomaculum schinkii TaxID=78350 RepID=A0A4Y7R7B0_9FIRM|nr:ABC transporter ATP-binding protein [Pelotomaculum schinkii]TEB04825.1 Macrolide export ATP-binding/permease protein MacB [Pelotomaculum schinkii]